jgi:K+ transporter
MYLIVMGLVGTALLYADGTITPAISVLSAVEGLTVDAPGSSLMWCRSPLRSWPSCFPSNE